MLISQQISIISIISILMLCHCTLIVWSGSLTRSVSSGPTSSNVNKTDKFVTLVDSKAKNISVSQPKEARTFSSSLEFIGGAFGLWHFSTPGLILHHVIKDNPLSPGPIKYFGQRAGQAWQNIANTFY